LKQVIIIATVAVVIIGMIVPSAYAEIQYDEERNFRIDLPHNWKSLDHSQWYSGFKLSENISLTQPIITITYGIDDKLIGGNIKNKSWEYDSYCDGDSLTWSAEKITIGPITAKIDNFGRDVTYTYKPYGYADYLQCDGTTILETKEWEDGNSHFKKTVEITTWKSEWEDRGLTNELKSIRMHITNGIEFWNVLADYDLKILNEIPDIDNKLTVIMDSIEPVTCDENTLTTITLNGERNPVLGEKYQYAIVVDHPLEIGLNYVVMGQNSLTYKIKNHPNIENSDNGYLSSTGKIMSTNFEIIYRNISYNEGESFIKITNGCFQESFPINIWETERILKEEISDVKETKIIPSWIKNNAGWWAEGTIDDNSFVQGIQFLIKEGIIVVDSTSQGTEESKEIPTWIKNNAGWWADGTIDDNSFIQGIQFLVKEGIIQVN